MRCRGVAIAVATAVVLVACNGDDDTASTTTPAPTSDDADSTTAPTSPPVSTSEPADATTVPTTAPTTDASTSTSTPPPTSTEPPTTDSTAPSTTVDPTVDEAVQARLDVVDVVEASFEASLAVRRDPLDDDKLEELGDYYTGNQLEGWQNIAQRYRERNLQLLVNPEADDRVEIELASLAVNDELDFATVQVCEVIAGILIEVGGNDDGSDRIVADDVDRTVVELEVVRLDDGWRVSSAREPADDERIASCV